MAKRKSNYQNLAWILEDSEFNGQRQEKLVANTKKNEKTGEYFKFIIDMTKGTAPVDFVNEKDGTVYKVHWCKVVYVAGEKSNFFLTGKKNIPLFQKEETYKGETSVHYSGGFFFNGRKMIIDINVDSDAELKDGKTGHWGAIVKTNIRPKSSSSGKSSSQGIW